jgi:hypothetical protein
LSDLLDIILFQWSLAYYSILCILVGLSDEQFIQLPACMYCHIVFI